MNKNACFENVWPFAFPVRIHFFIASPYTLLCRVQLKYIPIAFIFEFLLFHFIAIYNNNNT